MSDRKAALRQTILADHAASLDLLRALTPEQWAAPAPSDEDAAWTVRDVLIHLAISEAGQLSALRRVLAGEPAVPADFDLNRYNRGSVRKRAGHSVAELLAAIEAAHAEVLAQLEQTPAEDLDRQGRHARGDTLTVAEFFTRITAHRLDHAREIQRALAR